MNCSTASSSFWIFAFFLQGIATRSTSAFVIPSLSSSSFSTTTTKSTRSKATFVPRSNLSQQYYNPNNDNGNGNGINVLLAATTDTEAEGQPSVPPPQTFREAEILGLRLMQEGQHEQALEAFQKGMKLPGSKKDIIRTQKLSGPSPVGGSIGGTEGKIVMSLDEFEIQAAHYNIACACARLGKVTEACQNLEKAFQSGFDNYDTVRADPDLSDVHGSLEFDTLMEKWNPKKGFNPFGFFK